MSGVGWGLGPGALPSKNSQTARYVRQLAKKYAGEQVPALTRDEWAELRTLAAGELTTQNTQKR